MLKGKKVLVVDDQPTNRKLLRVNLEHETVEVMEAKDGHEALRLLDDPTFDAIISDVDMPEMDGYEFCRLWRQRDPSHRVPVVLFSSIDMTPVHRILGNEIGADAYLKRPVPFQALKEILNKLLGSGNVGT